MRVFSIAVLASLLSLSMVPVRGEEGTSVSTFRIVVHPESPIESMNRKLLADTFFKKKTRWTDGTVIRPVDQFPESVARKNFSDAVLRRSVQAVKSYWQLAIFSGRDVPPPELRGDQAVIQYVLQNVGAIGYVSQTADPGRARVVALK